MNEAHTLPAATDTAARIILNPPNADVVFVFSASWWVWAAIALGLLALVMLAAAMFAKKNPPPSS